MLKNILKSKKTKSVDIVSSVSGTYVNLEEVPDPVFSTRIFSSIVIF